MYFEIGWHHIISWNALDHLLFIIALGAIYLVPNWKQVLLLITAFTIGHSLTLALSVYDVVRFNVKWVEFLIPCTIIATAIINFSVKKFRYSTLSYQYLLALFFGLVHGMGFANTIRFMLSIDEDIALPLISFNVGLEAGQLLVVALLLLLSFLVVNKLTLPQKWWIRGWSAIAILPAIKMVVERWPL